MYGRLSSWKTNEAFLPPASIVAALCGYYYDDFLQYRQQKNRSISKQQKVDGLVSALFCSEIRYFGSPAVAHIYKSPCFENCGCHVALARIAAIEANVSSGRLPGEGICTEVLDACGAYFAGLEAQTGRYVLGPYFFFCILACICVYMCIYVYVCVCVCRCLRDF